MSEIKFPTEEVELPSKGLVYPEDNPLSSGKVEIKYMTAKEEDILTNQNYIKNGTVLDKLLKSLIVTPNVNYDDLLVGDKNAILIAARVLGYGGKYETKVNCPKCGEENIIEVDITSFRDKEIDFSKFNNENRFDFSLPISKKVITFRLTTHGDEMQAASAAKARKGKNRYGERTQSQVTARLKQQIISVDNDDSTDIINATVGGSAPTNPKFVA